MAPTSEVDASDVPTTTTSTEKRALSRRRFAAGVLGTAGLTGLAGCSSVLGDAAGGEEVTILLTPDTPSDVRPQYEPVMEMLRGEIDDLNLEVEVPQDYSAVRPALESKQAEIGMDDITLISSPDTMDLMGTANSGGAAFYFSMMLTQPDSDIESREDLEGKNIAFADRLSTSGSIFAVYALQEAGLDVGDAPDGDPVDFEGTWSNHEDAVQSLLNGDADACCTWTGNGMSYLAEDQELPEEVEAEDSFIGNRGEEGEELRPFWWSFPIPKQPIYARSDWDSDMKGKIEQALLDADEELIQEYMPEDYNEDDLPFTTLDDTSMNDYEPVIKRIDELGIELG